MLKELIPAVRMTLILALLTGLAFPLLITVISQFMFPDQANGSLIRNNGKVVGSKLIAQRFESPKYFPSKTVGSWIWIRRRGFWRHEPWPNLIQINHRNSRRPRHQSRRVFCRHQTTRRSLQKRQRTKSRRAYPSRCCDTLRLGTRP